MALTLADANQMIQAAIAKAEELQVKLSIAVCDTGGNLIAFSRMNGASAVSATVAQGKAAASAGFGRASGALQADSPVIQAIIATMGGRMLPARGAVRSTKRENSSEPSGGAVLPLNRTSNALRLGLLLSRLLCNARTVCLTVERCMGPEEGEDCDPSEEPGETLGSDETIGLRLPEIRAA